MTLVMPIDMSLTDRPLLFGILCLVGFIIGFILGIPPGLDWRPFFSRGPSCGGNGIRNISFAIDWYIEEQSTVPVVNANHGELVQDYRQVIALLASRKNMGGGTYLNTQQLNYVDGLPKDVFGNNFNIALDVDGDGLIRIGKKLLKDRYLVWSSGPDGVNDFCEGDDIYYGARWKD